MAEQLSNTGRGGRTNMRMFVEIPERPEQLAGARGGRKHNTFVKNAMRATLQFHHETNIPRHFRQNARGVYGYMPRSAKYMRQKLKKHRSMRDLVYTGATEKAWTSGQGYQSLRVGGTAEGDRALTGTLTYRWSWSERVAEAMKKKYATAKIESRQSKASVIRARGIRMQVKGALDQARTRRKGVTLDVMKQEAQKIIPAESKKLAEVMLAEYWRQVEAMPVKKRRIGRGVK